MKGIVKRNTTYDDEYIKRIKTLTTFNEIGKTLTSTLDVKEVFKLMMEKVSELLRPKNWSLLLLDENKNQLYFEIVVGENADKIRNVRLRLGEGVAGWVAREGIPLLVPDVRKDKRFSNKVDRAANFTTKSIICVPLISKGKTLGVIEVINKIDEGAFTEEDMLLLMTLADYTAIAIENAKYFKKIEELTITDDLTRLYNPRYLHRFLDYEIERTRRYKLNLSMIFFDLDYFKSINDTYGHVCGSKLLREVGSILRKIVRRVDMACRYGGDEFIIVMPQTKKENALLFAKSIKRRINRHVFLKEENLRIKITASFGIATIPEDAQNKLDLIHMADKAMYMVKGLKRNGIATASEL